MPSQDNFFKVKTGLGVGTDTLYASVEDTKVTIGATTGNYELNVIGTIYSDYDVLVDNNVGIGTTLPFQRLDVRGIGIFSGSVGIGTTLPVQIFQVNGIGTQSVVVTGLGSFGIGTLDPYHPFQYVGVGNSNLVVITGIGSVGIGTSLPNFDVDLFGDARVTGFATITNAFIGVATVGFATITNAFIGVATVGFATITNEFVGISTIGFATITDAFIGVATVGFATITNEFVGISTIGFATITNAFIGVATVGFATITNAFIGVATVGFATITNAFIGVATVGFATITNEFVGISTIGFATITNAFIGVATVGFATITNEFVGISTINQLLVTGITTTAELDVGIGATLSIFGNFQITPVTDLNDNLIKNIQPIVGINTIYPTRTLDVAGDLRVRGEVIDSGNNVGFAYSVLSSNGNNIPDRFSDAANLLLRNKNFIASEIVGFITSTQGPFGANGPLFDYGTAGVLVGRNKCKRDIKSIIDSIAFDISKGGNSKVVAAGLSYYTGNTLSYLDDTDPLPPGFDPNYVKTGTLAGISSISHFAKYVINNAVPPTSYQFGNNYHRSADAANLIKANKALIAEVAVARMLTEYSGFTVPNGNQNCVDDIIKVLEAVAYNVQFGYNDKVWDAAKLYVSNSYLEGEETQSVYAFEQARDMAIQAMRNQTITITGSSRVQVKDLSITVDLDSPTCANVASSITTLFSIVTQAIIVGQISFFVGDRFADASDLIKANKELIAEVAVDRMLTEYSGFTVPNGNQNCVDDIIKVLEAVAYNVQFGYNDKVWDAAQLYISGSHVVGEETQSVYAFEQARDMAIQAMRNETITITGSSRVQVKDLSITVDLDSPTCANVASSITTLFSIVTGAIDSGIIGSSVGDRFSDASNLIKANKALIAEVAVARMLVEYSGFVVPNGNQNCVDDIIKVLEAVAHNLRFGYNDKVWDAAQLYVSNSYLAGEENQSIYAFEQARDMAIQAMRNQTITITGSSRVQVKDLSITVDSSSPTCANVASAITTLNSIVTQAISTGSISNISRTLSDITPRTSLARTSAEFDSQLFDYLILPDGGSNTSPNGCSNVVSAIYTCVGIITSIIDGGISAAPPINNPIGNLVWNPPGAKIGNEWFVNKLGSDENYGRSPGDSFLTIKKACSVAQPGDTVRVYTGLYVEDGPIQVPERVAVVGEDLRRTLVSTRDKTDLYYVKRGCYIAQQSFVGPSNPGKAMVSFPVQGFGFANGTEQNWQSPYIQNCTNFVPDSIGLRIDGARAGGFKSMVLDAFTQYNQGGIGVSITNFGYAQLVSLFTICCDIAVFCDSGGVCDLNNSNVSFGNFGLVSDGATPLQYTGTVVESPEGDNVDGLVISVGIGASQEFIDSASLMILNKDFIAAEAVGFMTSTDGPFGIGATYFDYGGSSLGKSICIRDSKIIVESLVADLLNLSNLNAINAGLSYRDSSDGSLTYLPETSPPPGTLPYGYIKIAELALIDYIAGISTYIIQNINIPDTYQLGSIVGNRFADAANLIKANKALIAEVAVGRMLNNYSDPQFVVPNGNQNCVDDIIKVLEAVAYNVQFGYNDKVWDAAKLYVSNSYLEGEEAESIYAFNQARDMAIQAMRNQDIEIAVYSSRVQVKDTTITVDLDSPTCANVASSITTLFFIITEVISLGSIITIDRSSGAGILDQVKDLSKSYSPLANTFISSRAGIITSIIGIGVAAMPEKILPKGQRPYDGQVAYIDTQYYFIREIIIDNPGSGYNPNIPVNVVVDFPLNSDYFIPAEAAIFETDVNFDGTISNISVLVSGTGYNENPPNITIDPPISGVTATATAVMEKYFFNPVSSTPVSVVLPVGDRFADASDLIKANKELIAEVAVARMLVEYSGFVVPNGNQNCVDDIIKVLEAVAHNLRFGYNDKVWDAAQLYISGSHVVGEEPESIYAFEQAKDMAIQAMRNQTITITGSSRVQVKDTTITVDLDSPTCANVASSITTLFSIVTGAISTGSISDINRTYSDSGGITKVTFDQFITYSPLIGVGSTVYFFQSSKIIASGITFEFVGCGINIVDSIPSKGAVPIVENQIVPSNGGKVPFTSTDQGGNFRISEGITINQNTGTITGQAFSKSLQAEVTPLIIALQR